MTKELKALQDLSKLVFIYGGVEQYKIIETALKRLAKQNKVLKIVKKKVMGFVIIKAEKERYRVYDGEEYYYENLTQKEYDLLKEVFGNE